MPQRPPSPRRPDFAALVAVLATGVSLVALGVEPESLAAVTIALSGLYSAWRARPGDRKPDPGQSPEEIENRPSGPEANGRHRP